jgi:hypothetical protein
VNPSINGIYAAYLTGSALQGFAMLTFIDGKVVGVDSGGVKYDGTYSDAVAGYTVKIKLTVPPRTGLVQGVTTGAQVDVSELAFELPLNFLAQPFLRVNTKYGPVNAKIVKLRALDE